MVTQVVESSSDQAAERAKVKRVKVRVKKDDVSGEVIIESSQTIGSVPAIILHLPSIKMVRRAETTHRNYGGSLKQVIANVGASIPKEVWANAIAAEIIARNAEPPDAEAELSAVARGGYLALDNAVYRLTPVECAPTNKAMSALRRRILDKSKAEAAKIISVAEGQASAIFDKANAGMRELSDAKAKFAEERKKYKAPPAWMLPYMIKWTGSRWYIGFSFAISFTTFEYDVATNTGWRTKRWNALPQPAYQCVAWIPIEDADGHYNYRSIHIDQNFSPLPHTHHEGSCMALPDAPPLLNSAIAFSALTGSFLRCMRKVALHSLYSRAVYWPKVLQDAMPESIRRLVLAGNQAELRLDNYTPDSFEDFEHRTEEAATWTANP